MTADLRPVLCALLLTLGACPADKGTDSNSGLTEIDTTGETMTEPTSGATEQPEPTSGATEQPDETGETGETGEPMFVDLFACAAPLACEQIVAHLDPEPVTALECAARLVISPEPGIISYLHTPGPDIDETEMLIVSRGDGTALLQTRERHCSDEDVGCDWDIPWEPSSAHQICTLDIPADLADACACGEDSCVDCYWDPFFGGLVDCQPVEELSCDDLLALVGE